jgi:hypothetical protein
MVDVVPPPIAMAPFHNTYEILFVSFLKPHGRMSNERVVK